MAAYICGCLCLRTFIECRHASRAGVIQSFAMQSHHHHDVPKWICWYLLVKHLTCDYSVLPLIHLINDHLEPSQLLVLGDTGIQFTYAPTIL